MPDLSWGVSWNCRLNLALVLARRSRARTYSSPTNGRKCQVLKISYWLPPCVEDGTDECGDCAEAGGGPGCDWATGKVKADWGIELDEILLTLWKALKNYQLIQTFRIKLNVNANPPFFIEHFMVICLSCFLYKTFISSSSDPVTKAYSICFIFLDLRWSMMLRGSCMVFITSTSKYLDMPSHILSSELSGTFNYGLKGSFTAVVAWPSSLSAHLVFSRTIPAAASCKFLALPPAISAIQGSSVFSSSMSSYPFGFAL